MVSLGMMRLTLYSSVIFLFTLTQMSCKSNKEPQANDEKALAVETKTDIQANSDLRPITVNPEFRDGQTDAFYLDGVSVSGDTLKVEVRYGGGCKEHEWEMHTTGMYAKSYPPQLSLFLAHKNNGDMCKAMLRETLYFDLVGIQYPASDVLNLRMNLADDFIVYSY